jgi:hypothetical protein
VTYSRLLEFVEEATGGVDEATERYFFFVKE